MTIRVKLVRVVALLSGEGLLPDRDIQHFPMHDGQEHGFALRALLSPRSIAIIGASDNPNKLSGRVLSHLRLHGFGGALWPVNPSRDEIGGLRCHADVPGLPAAPDLAIVALAPEAAAAAVEALARRGARAVAVMSSGFGETGAEGRALETRMAEIARQANMALLGPNGLGFVNAFDKVAASFSQYAEGEILASPIAFASQSGAFGTAIAGLARARGFGLGLFVNTGNEAALDIWDILGAALEDPRVGILAGYVENIGDGRKMAALARRAAAAGKPVVLAKVGSSARGAQAAAAHTGALATPGRLFSGIARQTGIIEVACEREMLNVLEVLLRVGELPGPRLGVVTMSGGAGVLMADLAETLNMPLAELSDTTRARLSDCVPAFGSLRNPVDITAQFVSDPGILEGAVAALQDDPEVDCVIVWLQMMEAHVARLAQSLGRCRAASRTPLLVAWIAAPPETRAALAAQGIAHFDNGGDAVRAVRALSGRGTGLGALHDAPAPPAAGPGPGTPAVLGPEAGAAFLAGCGVPLALPRLVRSAGEAVAAGAQGGRFALKIASPDIAHKSDIGGVILDVAGAQALRDAFETLIARVRQANPAARIEGVSVQPMAEEGVELVFGARHDPAFGPVVMLGHGGVLVELFEGAEFALAPVSRAQARAMVGRLPAQALLDGARGRPGVDRDALAARFADFSEFVASRAGNLSEVDLNPVVLRGAEALAVDWLVSVGEAP